jgi:hypothetical protein
LSVPGRHTFATRRAGGVRLDALEPSSATSQQEEEQRHDREDDEDDQHCAHASSLPYPRVAILDRSSGAAVQLLGWLG